MASGGGRGAEFQRSILEQEEIRATMRESSPWTTESDGMKFIGCCLSICGQMKCTDLVLPPSEEVVLRSDSSDEVAHFPGCRLLCLQSLAYETKMMPQNLYVAGECSFTRADVKNIAIMNRATLRGSLKKGLKWPAAVTAYTCPSCLKEHVPEKATRPKTRYILLYQQLLCSSTLGAMGMRIQMRIMCVGCYAALSDVQRPENQPIARTSPGGPAVPNYPVLTRSLGLAQMDASTLSAVCRSWNCPDLGKRPVDDATTVAQLPCAHALHNIVNGCGLYGALSSFAGQMVGTNMSGAGMPMRVSKSMTAANRGQQVFRSTTTICSNVGCSEVGTMACSGCVKGGVTSTKAGQAVYCGSECQVRRKGVEGGASLCRYHAVVRVCVCVCFG